MTRLIVNARYKNRPITGVERFAGEVGKALRNRGKIAGEIDPGQELSGLKGHAWEQLVLPRKISSSDILFSPCNTGPVAVRNQFVVIHDAAVWDYPEGFSKSFATVYQTLLPRLAKRSRWVGTVSEFSRTRLAEWLPVREEEIVVLGNATSPDFKPDATKRNATPLRFFCVSSLDPRKNFHRLVKAWNILEEKGVLPPGTTLRIAGGANPQNFSAIDVEDSDSVTWLGRISDEQLIEEYQSATAFLFPSIYEGFGLPPLEALACGCPVLLSDRASLPEVGGPEFAPEKATGAVMYFDPTDIDSIADTIARFISLEPGHLESLSKNAVERSREFSWSGVADRIIGAIED